MIFNEDNIIPSKLVGDLQPYYLLEFADFPYITVDISLTGTKFLNYFIDFADNYEERILIEISDERVKLVCSGEMSIDYAFKNPENKIVYVCHINQQGNIENASYYNDTEFVEICPVPENHKVIFDFSYEPETIDFKIQAKQRHRILIDIYMNANSLKSNLKYWAVKNFLVPFTELVKTTILNNNKSYQPERIEGALNMGYNRVALGSLRTTLEFNYNPDLFGNSTELDNLTNLYLLFNSETEEELIQYLDKFVNKKVIADYLKILRVVIKNEATLETKIAAPNDYFGNTYFNKNKAAKIKKIIDTKIPEIEDIEEMEGILLELSFDKQNPTFSMSASNEDFKCHGKICKELVERIGEKSFQFLSTEYLFKIKTLYRPQSSTSAEKTERTLLDITEI